MLDGQLQPLCALSVLHVGPALGREMPQIATSDSCEPLVLRRLEGHTAVLRADSKDFNRGFPTLKRSLQGGDTKAKWDFSSRCCEIIRGFQGLAQ